MREVLLRSISGASAGAIVVIVIAVVIGLSLMPVVVTSTHDAGASGRSDVFNGVATGAGETSKNVTLTQPHFHTDCTHITITSSLGTDNPTCGAYNASTRTVTVNGLTASATRNLTVNYEVDALASFAGAGAILKLVPLVFIGGLIVLAVMWFIRGKS